MAISATDIQSMFSEFASTDSSLITTYLNFAATRISDSYFGNLYDQAHAYLTAHMLKIESSGTVSSSSITSKKVGDIQTNYANPSSSASLGETIYGKMFEQIREGAKGRGPTVLT